MSRPVFGLLLGGFLGIFDGLTALVSAPEVAPQIMGIVIGSTFKGMLAGLLIGLFARRGRPVVSTVLFGFAVGLALAFLVAAMPQPDGTHYWWEIMLPGGILGLIVGYATARQSSARTVEQTSGQVQRPR